MSNILNDSLKLLKTATMSRKFITTERCLWYVRNRKDYLFWY